jgi:transaldolase
MKERNYPVGFIGGGARGLHHFTEMVGADACITINWSGTADELVKTDPPVLQRFFMPTPLSVIDELVQKIEDYRRGYFAGALRAEEYESFGPVVLFRTMFEKAWSDALGAIAARRDAGREIIEL